MSSNKIDVQIVIPQIEKTVTLQLEPLTTLAQIADFLKQSQIIPVYSANQKGGFYKIKGNRPYPQRANIEQLACGQDSLTLVLKKMNKSKNNINNPQEACCIIY